MILRRTLPLLLALFVLPLASAGAADGPRPPSLHPDALDLLPFDNFERQDFNKEHGTLVYRMQAIRKQVGKLYKERATLQAKRGKKSAADIKRLAVLQKELRRTAPQVSALMARITDEVRDHGVDGALIAYMNHAPKGPGRMQRYSHGLVLLLDDLTPAERWLFERVTTQVEGAYHAIGAQKERTLLALKQTELDKDKQGALARTFDSQLRLIEKRFWQLVDCTLARDQKVWIWERLPQQMKRKGQAQEHLYALPGLSGSQGTRLRALATEIEHEASPDNAAVRRLTLEIGGRGSDRKPTAKQRQALYKERGVVYGRLNELNRFRQTETRKILSEDQWLDYLAIPPRLSTNDRSGSYRRLLEGWKPSAAQQKQIDALRKGQRDAAAAARKKMALARREGADYGPDSPQMMAMQMMMSDAKAGQAEAGRALLGAIFRDVMTDDDVGRWVLGHWGYKQ
ncbi:MAG: hypothetical protein P1V36_04605 [Planctomycetota bacterium]|nr:hypothetical protein [Planctomycetota bacterium]